MGNVAPPGANMQSSLLELFCEALDAAVFFTDKSDCLIFASRRFAKTYSVPEINLQPGTRVRQLFASLYDGGMHPNNFGAAQKIALSKDEWVAERIALIWRERHEVQEQIGRERWIKLVTRRLPSGMGMTAIVDISETRKREAQWRSDSERVKLTEEILDDLPVPVFVQDRNLNFAAVNKAFCSLQSTTADNLLGRSIWDLFAPDLAAEFDESSRMNLQTGKASDSLLQMRRPDGEELFMVANAKRIGRPGQYFIANCFSDVSQYLGAAPVEKKELPQASRKAETNCADSALQSEVSKSSITSARQANERTAAASPSRNIAVLTPNMERGAIVTGILKAAGHDCCVLHTLAELEAFLPAVQQAGLAINFLLIDRPGLSEMEKFSTGQLEQALSQNASAAHDLPLDGDGDVDFNGLIAMMETPCQEPSVSAMPAEINSEARKLPVMPMANCTSFASARRPKETPVEAEKIKDVLVVEDNKINRHVFDQVLESLGIQHQIVETAAEALVAWRTRKPAMMLVDLTLPDMDGCDLARFIRKEQGNAHLPTPIIGVLARHSEDEQRRCLLAGMEDTIVKPLSPDLIDALFRKYALGDDAGLSLAV